MFRFYFLLDAINSVFMVYAPAFQIIIVCAIQVGPAITVLLTVYVTDIVRAQKVSVVVISVTTTLLVQTAIYALLEASETLFLFLYGIVYLKQNVLFLVITTIC